MAMAGEVRMSVRAFPQLCPMPWHQASNCHPAEAGQAHLDGSHPFINDPHHHDRILRTV